MCFAQLFLFKDCTNKLGVKLQVDTIGVGYEGCPGPNPEARPRIPRQVAIFHVCSAVAFSVSVI